MNGDIGKIAQVMHETVADLFRDLMPVRDGQAFIDSHIRFGMETMA